MSDDERPAASDPEGERIPKEETALLQRVLGSIDRGAGAAAQDRFLHDRQLVELRDEIAEARLEDVPALVAQMERLQGIAHGRAQVQGALIDPASPYFGHLRLREQVEGRGEVERDVLIGRGTYVDARSRVNVVDWRDAPVSQLYYRYEEGSDYEERFGDREVTGEILARRTVTIENSVLRRIACAQGEWVLAPDEGAAGPARWHHRPPITGDLAGGQGVAMRPQSSPAEVIPRTQRLDRHLPEIAALLDRRQFELVTAPEAGLLVIQGGAGSGKTTVGLHRLAYLAYARKDLFPPRRMLVVTYGSALADYVSQLLPALGVTGVRVLTFGAWVRNQLRRAIPWLPAEVGDEPASVEARVKSHPALLRALDERAARWTGRRSSRAVVEVWLDLMSDRSALLAWLTGEAAGADRLGADEVGHAHRSFIERLEPWLGRDLGPNAAEEAEAARDIPEDEAERDAADQEERGAVGIDGRPTDERHVTLDLQDAAMLLRLHQRVRGAGARLAHLFVDEAQDLSPVQLATLIAETGPRRSVTLAGDTSQRLFLDNGFGDWRSVLQQLGFAHTAIEPLRLAYRSTREILAVARHAMGPLADPVAPEAPRSGAPVSLFRFPAPGAAAAFLADALRSLLAREPRASVALVARHPEQADRVYEPLRRADVPGVRRVRQQEFSFRPGVEVTDVRQVKGLEFDYVVMLDVNASTYGADPESRHLFHIAATRAAHQLWLLVTAAPSPLLPPALLAAGA